MPKDTTVPDLDTLHRKARSARSKLEPVWFLNLAYFMNEQWVAWDGRQLHKPQLRKNRITVVENRIAGVVRTEIAKMTKNQPVFTCTPRTGDEEDANAAQLAEQIIRYLWVHLQMPEIAGKALEWSRITGAGFLKLYWDRSIGDKVDVMVGPGGDLLTDGQGAPVKADSPEAQLATQMAPDRVTKKTVAQGDVRVEARSPFQMFLDPLADSFSEIEWAIEESIKSQEYVRRRYGVDIEPDTPANPGLVEARMGQVFLPGTGQYKGIRVREYWCKPNSQWPNGYRAVWTAGEGKSDGKMLLQDDKPFDPMPYVMLSGIPVPGRLWPMSTVELLRGPQTELNKVRSQMAENRNRVGNPTVVASKQAVQDPEKFTDSMTMPGGVYFFDDVGSPNTVPQFLQAPPLPNYVVEEVQRIEQAIEDIAGQHEVTSAQVPPGVTAASAINLLMEADDTRLAPAIRDYERQLGYLGQKLLKLVATYYTDARTVKIGGDNGAWQIFDFRGTMLRDNTHVEVQAGSAFPTSKAAKQAAMQDLLTFFVQSGQPPQGRKLAQFLKDWDMGGAERLIEDYTRDETQINRENQLLMQGKQQRINDYDDDQAHIDGHTDEQKSIRYTQLPPQIQQIVEQHVALHRQRLADHQQAQMQLEQQMQGQQGPSPEEQQMGLQGQQQQQDQQAAQSQQQMQGADQQQQQKAQQAQQAQQLALEQAQQQQQGQSTQQGHQQATQEQQQRQAEELHQQKLRHGEEQHQARLKAQEQQAKQHAQQAKQQAQQKKEQSSGNKPGSANSR
jgi:hypothetical protein